MEGGRQTAVASAPGWRCSTPAEDVHALPVLLAAVRHGPAPRSGRAARRARRAAAGCARRAGPRPSCSTHPQRLTAPLMRARRGAPLRAVSWDEALDRVAGEFARRRERHGRDAVGVFGGGGLTNEKAYPLGKFARVALRTASIDYNGRFCMSSAAAAAQPAFGLDRGLPFPLEDIAAAPTRSCSSARNLAETMPPAVVHLDDAAAQRRPADRRRPARARRPRAARDAAPAARARHGPRARATACCTSRSRTGSSTRSSSPSARRGFDACARSASAPTGPTASSGSPACPCETLRADARTCSPRRRSAMVLTARGPEQQSKGTDTVLGVHQPRARARARPAGPGAATAA